MCVRLCADLPIGKGSFHNANKPRQIVSTINTCHQADYLLLEDLSDGYVCVGYGGGLCC